MYNITFLSNSDLIFETMCTPNNAYWCFPSKCKNWLEYAESLRPLHTTLDTWWIGIFKNGVYMGMFLVEPQSYGLGVIHTTLLPRAYGQAVQIGLELSHWLLENTEIRILQTVCDPDNRLICRLAQKVGFRRIGPSGQEWESKPLDIYELYVS